MLAPLYWEREEKGEARAWLLWLGACLGLCTYNGPIVGANYGQVRALSPQPGID